MKSKRSEKYILDCEQDSKILYRDEVFTAVKLAEQDARDKAIDSLKKIICEYLYDSDCTTYGCEQCRYIKEFLDHYDK